MIIYDAGKWHLWFAASLKGSVLPKAICWGLPSAIMAYFMHYMVKIGRVETITEDNAGLAQGWAGFNFVLGFLLVFRTQISYARFWEGATMLENVRAQWINASKQLFAFVSSEPDRILDVRRFHHTAARLMSLMFCTLAMEAATAPFDFEVLDLDVIDPHAIAFLETQEKKYEIVHSWICRYVIVAQQEGVLTAPPPILSRVFQDLGHGMRDARSMIKLQILFPFPYAQVLTWILMVHTCATPVVTACLMSSGRWTVSLTFINVSLFWSILYIAGELENPFGNDYNDLPLLEMQKSFNDTVSRLIDPRVQNVPRLTFDNSLLECWRLGHSPYWSVVETMLKKAENCKQATAILYEGREEARTKLFKLPPDIPNVTVIEGEELRTVFASGAMMKKSMSMGKQYFERSAPPDLVGTASMPLERMPPQEPYKGGGIDPMMAAIDKKQFAAPSAETISPARAAANEPSSMYGTNSTPDLMANARSHPEHAMRSVKTADNKTLAMLTKKKKKPLNKAAPGQPHPSRLVGGPAGQYALGEP
jgi:putative membrane protein